MASNEAGVTSDYPPLPKYLDELAQGTIVDPPPIPADGVYTVFGVPRKLVELTPTLESQGLKTLFDANQERKSEIKKLVELSRSKFSELVITLGNDDAEEALTAKVRDLDMCLINLLYLTNELREEQAKVAIRDMLRKQVDAKKAAVRLLDYAEKNAAKRIREAFESSGNSMDATMSSSSEQASNPQQQASGSSGALDKDMLLRAQSIVETELRILK